MVETASVDRSARDASDRVDAYLDLLRRFDSRGMSVADFERTYIDTYLADQTIWPEDLYQVLNEVFLDVDAYNPDPESMSEFDIDEESLRRGVRAALIALEDLSMVRA